MQRDFRALNATFDVAIIGGGITGACIARDAARRGMSVALVEKRDFSCGTSAGSSKLVHGGLRYLKTFQFGLIRESLKERRVWAHIAPHMVYPLQFLLPVKNVAEAWFVGAGLTAYDWLAFDRNRLADPDQHMAGHHAISAAEALKLEPAVEGNGMASALLYYDCQMYSPERLGLECLIDAAAHGAVVANHAEAVAFERGDGGVACARVRDHIGGDEASLKARLFVNAAGPWADRLDELISGRAASHKLMRSKGIHLITHRLTKGRALAVNHRGGHVFLLPWRDHTIIGTTDTMFRDEPDALNVTESDVADYLVYVNSALPALKLKREHVLFAYAGLRPLVDDGSKDSYNASRRAQLVDHAAEGGPRNLISAIGGKWTTSRDNAEKCVDLIARKLNVAKTCETALAPLPGASGRFTHFVERLTAEAPAASIAANLARNYGARARQVLALGRDDPALLKAVSQRLPDIAAQVVFAVRCEMAMTLDDIVFRRTGLGTLGRLDALELEEVGTLAGQLLGWSKQERERQIASIAWRYEALGTA